MEETKHDNAIVRNSHPAERQTETISKYDVCNLSALMSAEERCIGVLDIKILYQDIICLH